MNSPKTLRIAVTVLCIALVVTLGVLIWAFWQLHIWREAVDTVADEAGSEWATISIRGDHFMIYELSVGVAETNGMPEFSGRRDGPFEVWLAPDYTDLAAPFRYAQRKEIEAFNSHMRFLYKHPQFYRKESGVTNTTSRPNTALEPTATAPSVLTNK